jgi:hypothetical protein
MSPALWVLLTCAAFIGTMLTETAGGLLQMAAVTMVLGWLSLGSLAKWAVEGQ